MGLLFLVPGLLFLGVFLIYPVINSVVMSFTNWNGFNNDFSFIGLDNYINLFTNNKEY